MSKLGWYSADHHVHAAGCSHYDSPTEGVNPKDMWRQALGEDLNIAAELAWGPSWYHQKTFFTGKDDPLSTEKISCEMMWKFLVFLPHIPDILCCCGLKKMIIREQRKLRNGQAGRARFCPGQNRRVVLSDMRIPAGDLEPAQPTRQLPELYHAENGWYRS